MKTTKEKADKLIDAYRTYIRQADKYTTLLSSDEVHLALKSAILSVEHTIEILKNVITHDKERYGITCRGATIEIEEQTKLLKELESRL